MNAAEGSSQNTVSGGMFLEFMSSVHAVGVVVLVAVVVNYKISRCMGIQMACKCPQNSSSNKLFLFDRQWLFLLSSQHCRAAR